MLGHPSLMVLTGDRLQRIDPNGGQAGKQWTTTARADLQRASDRAVPVIASSSQWAIVAQGDLPVRIFDALTLQAVGQWDNDSRQADVQGTPMELIAISEDHFLLLTSSGNCDIVKVAGSTIEHVMRLPMDEIESVHWQPAVTPDETGNLLVAHDVDRLTRFAITLPNSSTGSVEAMVVDSITPALSVWRWVDYYVVGGLEWLTPQVLQLGDTSSAMVSGNDSLVIGGGESGVAEVVRYRIAGPLISCGVFITVMLLTSCVYFSRSDY